MKHFTENSIFKLACTIVIAVVGLNITITGLTGGLVRAETLWSFPLVASDLGLP
jgi:hypothetical protein